MTGTGAWQTECTGYSEVYNCVLACNACNALYVEPLERESWPQRKVLPVVTLKDVHAYFLLLTLVWDQITNKYTFISVQSQKLA